MNCETSLDHQRQLIVMRHVAYAERVAKKFFKQFSNCGVDLDDFVGAAYFGLCDAGSRFDPDAGCKFKTFSFIRMRGAIYDLLRAHSGLNRGAYAASRMDAGRADSGFGLQQYRSLPLEVAELGIRIHGPAAEDTSEISYSTGFCPEERAIGASIRTYLDGLLDRLPECQREILRLKYFEDCSYRQMCGAFDGATKSWISRLHGRAIDALRCCVEADDHNCGVRMASYEG